MTHTGARAHIASGDNELETAKKQLLYTKLGYSVSF